MGELTQAFVIRFEALERWLALRPGLRVGGNTAVLGQRSRLCGLISSAFDENELQGLALELGIEYEGLMGQGKGAKVRELVAYLERRGELGKLLELLRRERPRVEW